jgi:hypothetical protein
MSGIQDDKMFGLKIYASHFRNEKMKEEKEASPPALP